MCTTLLFSGHCRAVPWASVSEHDLRSRDRCVSLRGKRRKLWVCAIGVKRVQRRKGQDVHLEWLAVRRRICVAGSDDLSDNASIPLHDVHSLVLVGFELRRTTRVNPKADYNLQ